MKKYLFIVLALVAVSCTLADPVREPSPADIACGVYFLAADKTNQINLPVATVEATDTQYTYYLGRTSNQGDITVGLINHSDPCFTVPSSVTFKSGEYTAPVVITFESVPAADTPVSIEVDPNYVSLYAAGSPKLNVALNCLWETLGVGQWYDWYYGEIWDVPVQKSKVAPIRYRILEVYTEEQAMAAGAGSMFDKSLVPEFVELTVAEPDAEGVQYITWDRFWYIALNYQSTPGQAIKAYLPSALASSQAPNDALSHVLDEFDGMVFQMAPYYYIDGLGGFGVNACYLSLPGGPDLYDIL